MLRNAIVLACVDFVLVFQIRLDESQEQEANLLSDRRQRELEILTAYQSKSRMAADSQRQRERRELEARVSVRRALLGQKKEEEIIMRGEEEEAALQLHTYHPRL